MDDQVPKKSIEEDLGACDPAEAGMNADKLAEAAAFAEANESTATRDLAEGLASVLRAREPAPWNEVIGPTKPRGEPNGLVLRGGRVVTEWGDTARVDMTFSATKSYLAIVAGLAVADGLIGDVDDPVAGYALDDRFETEQNRSITWRHLLHQTNEWEGTLWDKPDLVDRNRQVGVGSDNSQKGTHRDLQAPGTFFEYNDVRVNLLALSLMEVFRRPLPEVLKERVMDPIGASDQWEWHGYENSYVEIDGQRMQSVSGGAHWGGGLWISSRDHARVGQLILNRGSWGGSEILPESWVEDMTTPSPCNPGYGYLWWLNRNGEQSPGAPASSVFALGAGYNAICVVPDHDIVTVVRWIAQDKVGELLGLVLASLE